jgi:sugar transferase (PEP-CTERM/EpsH1 system associated)
VNILFVCHRVPFPPKRGGKIRPFNVIRHLTQQGHRVTVASLARNEDELAEASGLKQHCEKALVEVVPNGRAWAQTVAWLPTARPSSFGYFYSSALQRRIDEELRGGVYDLVFVHCSSVAPYVRNARAARILDYGDLDSQKWRDYSKHRRFPLSAGYWLEAVKLERVERELSRNFDLCTCTTRGELESLRQLGVTTRADWFPNGVDAEFFAPAPLPYDKELIAFVGRMDYFPNQQAVQLFCEHVLPRIAARRPGVKFQIVGADPPREITALGRLPNVEVTGSVRDVRPYVTRAAVTVAPLEIARGTQNKILESMAMGVPVVCSERAAAGVDVVAGEHLLTARDYSGYADAIERLLAAPAERERLARAGRERVLSHHSWSGSMRRVDDLIAGVVDSRSRMVG